MISLAPNLFFGTTIAVNILVMSKHKTDTRVQFIDASGLFKKETNNNILTDGHIEKIMQVFASKADIDHLAKTIPYETVSANDYNLSVSSYVEAMDTREIVDIAVLNAELKLPSAKSISCAKTLIRLWPKLKTMRHGHERVKLSGKLLDGAEVEWLPLGVLGELVRGNGLPKLILLRQVFLLFTMVRFIPFMAFQQKPQSPLFHKIQLKS